MNKWIWSLACVFLVTVPGTMALADNDHLEKKILELEERQAELYHSLKEKKSAGLMEKATDKISIGGVVEVEAGYEDNNEVNEKTSDIVLATVEIGIDAEINDKMKGHILLLWEEDDTPLDIDEGTITLTAPYGLSLTAGNMYVPFGAFNSHFISDPFTLELGETNESGLLVSYGTDLYELALGVFNGEVREAGKDDKVDDIVASVTVNPAEGISFGASYISDISESDGDITGAAGGAGTLTDIVAGYSAFFSGSFGPIAVEGEYLAAANGFKVADVDINGDGKEDEPSAYNVEIAFAVSDATEVAARYEGSDDLDMPEKQYGVAGSYGLYENTSLALEYMNGEYKSGKKRDLLTAQLAVEF